MPHVEIEILLPVQLQHGRGLLHRDALRTWLLLAVIVQPIVAMLLVALPPAPHRPIRNPDNHFRLPAIALKITCCTFIIRSTSAAVTCWFIPPALPAAFSKRTDHVLIRPDKSHATNSTDHSRPLPRFPSPSEPAASLNQNREKMFCRCREPPAALEYSRTPPMRLLGAERCDHRRQQRAATDRRSQMLPGT